LVATTSSLGKAANTTFDCCEPVVVALRPVIREAGSDEAVAGVSVVHLHHQVLALPTLVVSPACVPI